MSLKSDQLEIGFSIKYLNIKIIYNLEKNRFVLMCNRINAFVGVSNGKAEQSLGTLCHGQQPVEKTRSLFCICDSGVTRYQSSTNFTSSE